MGKYERFLADSQNDRSRSDIIATSSKKDDEAVEVLLIDTVNKKYMLDEDYYIQAYDSHNDKRISPTYVSRFVFDLIFNELKKSYKRFSIHFYD